LLLCVALVSFSCAESSLPVGPSPDSQPVVREILSQTENPPGAPNRRLTLVRYTIAPGAELVPHIHPGVQMASIVSGTLTYRVLSGTATIHRQVAASGVPASVENVVGPADTELRPGDTIIEEESMVHFGSNRTSGPIVILATLITDPGAELSVPVSKEAQ
ncbi:MAG: cupin domain-containing protein, partial [Vicinamibacterales bacterium]